MPPTPNSLTPGEVAAQLGVPRHRVEYVLRTRRAIRPARRAGIIRLYGPAAVAAIDRELRGITAARRRRQEVNRA